jgi:hypothetical protein
MLILVCPVADAVMPISAPPHLSPKPICRFIVAKTKLFCHKPGLHRPAEKGCRGDGHAGLFDKIEKPEHL